MTVVPAMAEDAGHVTMLQRSPSYVFPVPRKDPLPILLRRVLPDSVAHRLTGAVNITGWRRFYTWPRIPRLMRALVRKVNIKSISPRDTTSTSTSIPTTRRGTSGCVRHRRRPVQVDRRRQGLDRDRSHRAFTETGIQLESGDELDADVIVTATGLNMAPFGKIPLHVDARGVA